ncbi:MAG: acyl-ACP--UDP-N-acetylglucosamine O-acyltransferase [Chlamydiota bacterium]|nr:acyl-ACP--UDP-N-acetylglucosamine O-acyltransferase [Chlamydiota bacterium]
MSKQNIHPTAIIEDGAQIGDNVTIEPYAIIKKTVTLEDDVTVKSHVYIDGNTTIGEGSTIYPSASIGTKTQDLKFRGETTYVKIGKNCEIREFVTINSSCQEGSVVEVGDNCLIMAYCHIAHNCKVGNHVIMSNGASLAGHVIVEDHAIISGMTGVHQFVNIGCYAMVGGMSRISHDIPPYTICGGIPFKYGGINIVGLKRHQFPMETRKELAKAFRIICRSNFRFDQAIEKCENELAKIPEVLHWIDFCKGSKRGLMGLQGAIKESFEEEQADEDEQAFRKSIEKEQELVTSR